MSTSPVAEKVMVGGAKLQKAVVEWSKQSNHLFTTVFTTLLIVYALYADKLPALWRWQLSSTFGRLLLLLLLYIIHMVVGWIPALLFAVGIAITWANRPLFKPMGAKEDILQEGFANDVKSTKANKDHKWFIEQALQENPKKIVQDRVDTSAVQGS